MSIPLKLQVLPETANLRELLSSTSVGGKPLVVLSAEGDSLTVALDLAVPPMDTIEALKAVLPGVAVTLYPEKQVPKVVPHLQIQVVDLVNIALKVDSVWDCLFKKPPPVFDRDHWADSDQSDKYIYIPNCTRFQGDAAEDFNSNAMYTQVMLEAYKDACTLHDANPLVQLRSGEEIPVQALKPFHAVQNHIEGERASGLVDSALVDYQDGCLAEDYIKAISQLKVEQYFSEPARQTVLAKSEFILAGKTSHMYNQKFLQQFFSVLTVNYKEDFDKQFKAAAGQAQQALLNIFQGMIMDGFVLEASVKEFKSRLWVAGMGDKEQFLSNIYEEINNG